MPLILPLNNRGRDGGHLQFLIKEKVIMKNKEQLMEMTKSEINIELAKLGIELSSSKVKNTNKEKLVQMILDKRIKDAIATKLNVIPVKSTGKGAVAKTIEDDTQSDEPKNIDEMFQGDVVKLEDVRNEKNGKKPKSSSRPDYDKLYNQFRKALNEQGLNLFEGRTNRLGEMKALTHIKNMNWAVLITKTGFRFELFMMDDPDNINKLYLAMNKHGQDYTKIVGPTGSSKRHKICATHDGHNTKEQAQKFYHFHELLMVGINDVYPLPQTETKTA